MSLTDKEKIAEHTQLDTKPAERIAAFIPQASRKLKELIGDTKYEEFESNSEAPQQGSPADRAARAESFLSVFYSFHFLNLRPSNLGGFTKTLGWEERSEELMSLSEVNKYRDEIYGAAVELVQDLISELTEDDDQVFDAGRFQLSAINHETDG